MVAVLERNFSWFVVKQMTYHKIIIFRYNNHILKICNFTDFCVRSMVLAREITRMVIFLDSALRFIRNGHFEQTVLYRWFQVGVPQVGQMPDTNVC